MEKRPRIDRLKFFSDVLIILGTACIICGLINILTEDNMGSQEFGKCEICGKEANLTRTYFKYDIHCQCCGCKEDGRDMHSELVCHCKDCVPDVPRVIKPLLMSKIDNKPYRLPIKGMLPYAISGEFCIQHNLCEEHIK